MSKARRKRGAELHLGWLFGLVLVGCSSAPAQPPPPPASLEARLVCAAGKAALYELRFEEAFRNLHRAVHLDRDFLEAQDLLVIATLQGSCGVDPLPCAYPAFGGRPDVWAKLEPDLSLHRAASLQEFKRLKALGEDDEASEFLRCAESLRALEAEACGASVSKRGRFEVE